MALRNRGLALLLAGLVGLQLGCARKEAPAPMPAPEAVPAEESEEDRATANEVRRALVRFAYIDPEPLLPRPAQRPSYRLTELPELPPELYPPGVPRPAGGAAPLASNVVMHRSE